MPIATILFYWWIYHLPNLYKMHCTDSVIFCEFFGHQHGACVVSGCSAGCSKCVEIIDAQGTNYQTTCKACSTGFTLNSDKTCSRNTRLRQLLIKRLGRVCFSELIQLVKRD